MTDNTNLTLSLAVPAELNPHGLSIRMAGTLSDPLFCLLDACRVLALDQVSRVADRLDPDEVTRSKVIDSLGREQEATFVTEPGLYKVIVRSDKPAAKGFTRWICHDVLPCIRKHGCYPAPADPAKSMLELVLEVLSQMGIYHQPQIAQPVIRERPIELIDPREYTIRCWPGVTDKTLKNIVRRMDSAYRCHVGRPAPQLADDPRGRLMCEPEHLWCLTHAIAWYWSKEHPQIETDLAFTD